jgi:hypothetical protein
MKLALGPEHITVWWVALGAGLVVELVALSLLEFLLGLVNTIDAAVLSVWEMGKRVAANTATTWMFNQTAQLVEELGREVGAGADAGPPAFRGNGGPPDRGNGGSPDQGPEPRRRSVPRGYLS